MHDDETKLPVQQTEAEEEATTSRRLDPELRALGAIIRILDDLPEPARCRAVAWIHSRYSKE
jgi:hypothetical protein